MHIKALISKVEAQRKMPNAKIKFYYVYGGDGGIAETGAKVKFSK